MVPTASLIPATYPYVTARILFGFGRMLDGTARSGFLHANRLNAELPQKE